MKMRTKTTTQRRDGPVQSFTGWVVFVTGLHKETQGDDDGCEAINLLRVNLIEKLESAKYSLWSNPKIKHRLKMPLTNCT